MFRCCQPAAAMLVARSAQRRPRSARRGPRSARRGRMLPRGLNMRYIGVSLAVRARPLKNELYTNRQKNPQHLQTTGDMFRNGTISGGSCTFEKSQLYTSRQKILSERPPTGVLRRFAPNLGGSCAHARGRGMRTCEAGRLETRNKPLPRTVGHSLAALYWEVYARGCKPGYPCTSELGRLPALARVPYPHPCASTWHLTCVDASA